MIPLKGSFSWALYLKELGIRSNGGTISSGHNIIVLTGSGCHLGICTPGSFDSMFYYLPPNIFGDLGFWLPGSSPSSSKTIYGPSFLGFVPKDHQAGGINIYPKRPALYL